MSVWESGSESESESGSQSESGDERVRARPGVGVEVVVGVGVGSGSGNFSVGVNVSVCVHLTVRVLVFLQSRRCVSVSVSFFADRSHVSSACDEQAGNPQFLRDVTVGISLLARDAPPSGVARTRIPSPRTSCSRRDRKNKQ